MAFPRTNMQVINMKSGNPVTIVEQEGKFATVQKSQARVYHKINDTIPISFLVTHFPVRSNGRPLTEKAWTTYCNWIGFDDQFIKDNYKEYIKGLKRHYQSKAITRYVVKTREMA